MNSDDRDAILGKTLRERKEVADHLAYLRVEGRRISERLELLARHLSSNIQLIQFESVDSPIPFQPITSPRPERESATLFSLVELDPKNVAALVREFNDATAKYRKLETDAKELGF
jgi:hypothetical protein